MTRTALPTAKPSRGSKSRSRSALKETLERAMRSKFPRDTVDVSDGFEDDIHVLVVSRIFDKMNVRSRYAYLWKIVEATDLSEREKDGVTVVVGVSPGELK